MESKFISLPIIHFLFQEDQLRVDTAGHWIIMKKKEPTCTLRKKQGEHIDKREEEKKTKQKPEGEAGSMLTYLNLIQLVIMKP